MIGPDDRKALERLHQVALEIHESVHDEGADTSDYMKKLTIELLVLAGYATGLAHRLNPQSAIENFERANSGAERKAD